MDPRQRGRLVSPRISENDWSIAPQTEKDADIQLVGPA